MSFRLVVVTTSLFSALVRCAAFGLPPNEVNQQLLFALQRDLEQKKTTATANAAVLLASKLKSLFPCSSL